MACGERDNGEMSSGGPEIEAICRAFEDAWWTQDVRRVEDFILRAPGFQSTMALRWLLAREMNLREAAGESIDLEEFRRDFRRSGRTSNLPINCIASVNACPATVRAPRMIVNWCKCWIAT